MTTVIRNRTTNPWAAWLLVAALAAFAGPAVHAHTLAIGTGTGTAGGADITVNIDFTATSQTNFNSQFDLVYDPTKITLKSVVAGAAISSLGATVQAGTEGATGTTVVQFFTSTTPRVSSGVLFVCTFAIKAGVTGSSFPISFANPSFGDNSQANPDITSQVTLTAGAINQPTAPTVTLAVAPTTVDVSNTSAQITATFTVPVQAGAKVSFTKNSGTGTAPADLTLTAVGSSTTVFAGTLTPAFANNGAYTLTVSATATSANNNLPLVVQPTANNSLTINLSVPPCSNVPSAAIQLSSSTFTANGTLTGTITFGNFCAGGGIAANPTVDIEGNSPIAATGITLTANSGSTTVFTFTRSIPSQAGVNGTYTVRVKATEAVSGQAAVASSNFTVNIANLPTVTISGVTAGATNQPGIVVLTATVANLAGATVTFAGDSANPTEASPALFSASANPVSFRALAPGTYKFTATATSGAGTASGSVTFTVANAKPVLRVAKSRLFVQRNATADRVIILNAGDSSDANGTTLTYTWSKGTNFPLAASADLSTVTSSQATLTIKAGATAITPTFNADITISDGTNQATTSVAVLVSSPGNVPPRAAASSAGNAKLTGSPLAATISLFGRDSVNPSNVTSTDPSKDLNFAWSGTGPSGAVSFGTQATARDPKISVATAGQYRFKLVVTQKLGDLLSDETFTDVLVLSATPARAVIKAGTITNGTDKTNNVSASAGRTTTEIVVTVSNNNATTISLNGGSSTGSSLTYVWKHNAFPGQTALSLTASGSTVSFPVGPNQVGTFEIGLTVASGGVPGIPAKVRVVVSRPAAGANLAVTATARKGSATGAPMTPDSTAAIGLDATGAADAGFVLAATPSGGTAPYVITWRQLTQANEFGFKVSTPLLRDFDTDPTGATVGGASGFSLSTSDGSTTGGGPTVGGEYAFLCVARDANGANATTVVRFHVVDTRATGYKPLKLVIKFGASTGTSKNTTDGNVVAPAGAITLGTGGALVLDFGSSTVRTTAAGGSSIGANGSGGYFLLSQLAGPTDLSTQLKTYNDGDGAAGKPKVTLTGLAKGDYLFGIEYDSKTAGGTSSFGLTAAEAAALNAASTDDGGGCALNVRSSGQGGIRFADLAFLLLPVGVVLGRRKVAFQNAR